MSGNPELLRNARIHVLYSNMYLWNGYRQITFYEEVKFETKSCVKQIRDLQLCLEYCMTSSITSGILTRSKFST
jgi:hypothetical protein